MAEAQTDRRMLWAGRILTALPALLLTMSGGMKVARAPDVLKGFAEFGYPEGAIVPIGLTELACVILFLVPRTAILGGLFTTAYLGGAVATHVRAGQGFAPAVLTGVVVWAALYAREERLRALVPLRKI